LIEETLKEIKKDIFYINDADEFTQEVMGWRGAISTVWV
jgi:hypothetical protein